MASGSNGRSGSKYIWKKDDKLAIERVDFKETDVTYEKNSLHVVSLGKLGLEAGKNDGKIKLKCYVGKLMGVDKDGMYGESVVNPEDTSIKYSI